LCEKTGLLNTTCYGCGEKGHNAKDLKCKNFGKSKPSAKMFVAQEILDKDDDGRADDGVVDQDRESGDHDENDQTPWDQYDSDVVGSQYSSEGEEVKFNKFNNGHWDHVERESFTLPHIFRPESGQNIRVQGDSPESGGLFLYMVFSL
jgi:hypothetical protein